MKTDNSGNNLNVEGVAENYSRCCLSKTGHLLEMKPRGQKRAAESAFSRVAMRSSTESGRVRVRIVAGHRRGLEQARNSGSAASSCYIDEHVAVASNITLSSEEKILPATVRSTDKI